MASKHSRFGQLLKDYLFFVGKTETALSEAINLSLNKVSAAIHGKYRLKRDHFDRTVTTLVEWGVDMTPEDYAEFTDAWRSLVSRSDLPIPPPLALPPVAWGEVELNELELNELTEMACNLPPVASRVGRLGVGGIHPRGPAWLLDPSYDERDRGEP